MKKYDSIFSDFSGMDFETWKEQAIKTLKGADFDKSLTRTTAEGITIQPYYTQGKGFENVSNTPADPYKPWDIIESILVEDFENANKAALKVLNEGATAIEFDLVKFPKPSALEIEQLTKDIDTSIANVFFLNVSENCALPLNYCHPIDGYSIKQKGANIIQEITCTLSLLQDFLEKGKSQKVWIRLSTGDSYFMEIAKFTAFRNLCETVLKEYGIPLENLYIQAVSTVLNKTTIDPYTNMLRNTTEAMAAIIGGCNGLTILPHDLLLSESKEMGKRIARNISLILQHESYFGKSPNPVPGTYFLENLVNEISEKSWALFLEIEEKGGFTALKIDLDKSIAENKRLQQKKINNRSKVLVGVNDFPDLTENLVQRTEYNTFERWSEQFEKLKKAFLIKKVKALVLTENSKMGSLRFSFSVNFFGSVGIQLLKLSGKTTEEQLSQLPIEKFDLLVVCTSNESWNEILPRLNKVKSLITIAGNTKDLVTEENALTASHCFYAGIDLVAYFEKLLKEI